MTLHRIKLLLLGFFLALANPALSEANQPIATDSRIKTFVYSENEVFRLVLHYGYQTSIEFAEDEQVKTISVGNNYAWQITPVAKRLFIKPLEENISTNMTIITNRRSYHFEVEARPLSYTVDEDLAYVVRFFYPDGNYDVTRPQVLENNGKGTDIAPTITPFNFNYAVQSDSYTRRTKGEKEHEAIKPVKVFDDGINTFFKFQNGDMKALTISVREGDRFKPLKYSKRAEYLVVNQVAQEFRISSGELAVTIYNKEKKK
jgi:type IV secretion system protein VirB9